MISEVVVTIMIIALLAIISFIIWAARRGNVQLIHKLYFVVSGFISIWILGVIGVHFTDPVIYRCFPFWIASCTSDARFAQ